MEEFIWPKEDATLEDGSIFYVTKEGYQGLAEGNYAKCTLAIYGPDNHYLLNVRVSRRISAGEVKKRVDELVPFLMNDRICSLHIHDGIYQQRSGRNLAQNADLEQYKRIEYSTLDNYKGVLYKNENGYDHLVITRPDGSVATDMPDSCMGYRADAMVWLVQELQKQDTKKYDPQTLDFGPAPWELPWFGLDGDQPACMGCP